MERNYLKKMREQKGLNQTELAKMLDMTRVNYCYIESGKTKSITLKYLKKLSDTLGIDMLEIIQREIEYADNY